MVGVNRWHGVGNMTSDPKLHQGDDEDGSNDRCDFSIAINKPPGRGGQEPEPTYIDLVAWGKLAGQVNSFGRKGRLIYVEGELEVRKWETDEGEKRKIYRIKTYVVRFLDRKPDSDEDDRPARRRNDDDEERPVSRKPRNKAEDFDDLPF